MPYKVLGIPLNILFAPQILAFKPLHIKRWFEERNPEKQYLKCEGHTIN